MSTNEASADKNLVKKKNKNVSKMFRRIYAVKLFTGFKTSTAFIISEGEHWKIHN